MAEATMTPTQPAMDNGPHNAPAGGFIKFFVPGLILGLVLGLFGGAFLMPLIENKVEQLSAPQGPKPAIKPATPATPDERTPVATPEGDKPAAPTGTPGEPAKPAEVKPTDTKPAETKPAPAPAPK